jgi:hypothetical protein
MKTVLIVSFYFSEDEIIGSHRSQGLAKYLNQFGWYPIIVTKKTEHPLHGGEYELIEVPFNSMRSVYKKSMGWKTDKSINEQKGLPVLKQKETTFGKTLMLLEDLALYPDGASSWIVSAEKAIKNSMKTRRIDAMISTSSPVSDHFIAHGIKRKYGLPWLADFRDLWSQNHYRSTKVKGVLNAVSERIIISDADMLTTVSEPLATKLKSVHPSKKITSILNGYSPNDLNPGIPTDNKFRIVHTGSLYRGRRDPDSLFRAISELVAEGSLSIDDILIDFYGPTEDWLIKNAATYGLENVVRVRGTIPRSDVIMEQRKAQILLLLTWDNPAEYGVYTGKIFEYIAAKRPILLLGSTDGVASKLLSDTGIGKSASTVDELKEMLIGYYSKYVRTGDAGKAISDHDLSHLSQVRMAREFSAALDMMVPSDK